MFSFGAKKEQRLPNRDRKEKILLSIIFLRKIESWRAHFKVESKNLVEKEKDWCAVFK